MSVARRSPFRVGVLVALVRGGLRAERPGRRAIRALFLVFVVVTAGMAAQQVPLPPPVEGGVTVKGSVVGPSGPLANVRVQLTGPNHFETVLTRMDGTFEQNVPGTGTYTFNVDDAGYRPAHGSFRIEQPGTFAAPPIRLNLSALHVKALSEDGKQPLEGVSLVASAADGGGEAKGTTDRNGEYYFGALQPGSYKLVASLAGYNPVAVDGVYIIGGGDTFNTTLLLVKGPSVAVARSQRPYRAPDVPAGTVQCVYQDGHGNIWLGTERGVTQFDGANFEGSDTPGSQLAALGQVGVRTIYEVDGKIWFGTPDGLRRLSGGVVESDPAFAGQDVRTIVVDRSGVPVVATSAGLYRWSTSLFERLAEGSFSSLTVDALDGSVWVVGGPPPGLHRLTGRDLIPAQFAASPALNGYAITCVLRTHGADLIVGSAIGAYRVVPGEGARETVVPFLDDTLRGVVNSITEDVRGNLWFGTDRGALIYDVKRRVTERFFDGERVASLMSDRESNLWFGTDQGAIKYDLYSFVPITTSRGLLNNNVEYAFADTGDAGQGLWFLTAGGLQRFDGTAFDLVTPPESDAHVRHLVRDHSGSVWLATTRGIYRGTGRDAVRVSDHPSRWLAETRDGRLWAATDRGVEVFGAQGFESVPELSSYLAVRLFAIGDDLWVTTDRNAVRFNAVRRTVDAVDVGRGLEGQDVRWIAADGKGRIWFATNAGIEVLDEASLLKLTDNAGVKSATDAETLLLDADGFMWAALEGGRVAKFALYDGGVVETTFEPDQLGIPSGTVINAITQDSSGSIWFATNSGTIQHTPTKTAPSVNVWVEVDGRRVEKQVVPAGPHTIRFHFNGVSTLGDVRYLYRLDGQGEWQLLPPRSEPERDVSYDALTAGAHTFELRALNRDLYGMQVSPTAVRIVIDVPIWRKGWFYGVGFLVLAGVGAGAGVAYRNRMREFVLPPELSSYVPIEPNPYIVGNPIRHASMFYGREDDFRYVQTKLEGASQGVVIVLCGERRTGKSSILYQILNGRLGERFIPVFIDLQEMVVANDREFFRRIARLVGEEVGMARSDVEAFGFADSTLNPYHQFVDFLDTVLARIGDKTLLMLVDEYELLEQKVEEQRLDPEVFLFLAGLMDSKERLSFVFTGSRRLEERDRRYWREILRRSFFRKVSFLSPNDAQRLVTEPVEGRVVYGRTVVDRIVRLTAGQPFYTQVVCQNVVDFLNEHEQNALGTRDLERVVAEIVDHPLPQMIYSWEALSPDEKVVLALLAESLAGDGTTWASAADLVALVGRIDAPVDLSENTIHLTLEELFRSEMLEKNAFEEYRFRIDLLSLWIRRSHSIWQVVKER